MDINLYRSLVMGISSQIPGTVNIFTRYYGSGGTLSARYCYSVWLRHMVVAYKNGLSVNPKIVAELGPGDSLGIGLAALLSGSEKYIGLDAVRYTNTDINLKILNDLVDLFKERARIPDNLEFPKVRPILESYEFPSYIFPEDQLNRALSEERIELIRESILDLNEDNKNTMIEYYAPWNTYDITKHKYVDMIISQAVMEYMDDLENTYRLLSTWIKPNGIMSHEIDFKSHGTTVKWNGHLTLSDSIWKLLRGKRPYFINRLTYSSHVVAQERTGFRIIGSIKDKKLSDIERSDLAPKFKDLDEEDLEISTALIQSIKGTQK